MQYSLKLGTRALSYSSDAIRMVSSVHVQHPKHVQSM